MHASSRALLRSRGLLNTLSRQHVLRTYSTQLPPPPPSHPSPKVPQPTPTGPQTRHEAHEQNLPINLPFNPPGGGGIPTFEITKNPLFDAALTTFIGIGIVFLGGVGYLKWYKWNVLNKIEEAFAPGYDPALELATHQKRPEHKPGHTDSDIEDLLLNGEEPWTEHLRRKEQDVVDRIIRGEEPGHYFVLLGPKGSGKGTMMFDSMAAIQADGIAMCDAHPDLEVFRLRLGKALNFEYNEDSQTGLFQRRDPREGGPGLDIERALNKLEKVALRLSKKRGRPIVLIINNVHFLQHNDEGQFMLLQLQQRAEAWAASGICTFVFSTDDFWPFYTLRKSGSRMHVLSISDLEAREARFACSRMRKTSEYSTDPEEIADVVEVLGGRLSYINKVSRQKDMLASAKNLLEIEKAWLLSRIGLIQDCDDDVMDEQKWSACSWLLLQEFVRLRQEQEKQLVEDKKSGKVPSWTRPADLPFPTIPYWLCRQLMTRTDFLEELDRINIISIDVRHNVRPDSMLILHAARQVVEESGFQDKLDSVRDRIDEIESLHRTRELTFKDLGKGDKVSLQVDKTGEDED
ncbi:hypothetical protein CYLTODRAFT_380101 [Cylindrobasidium torrendii FP15055 ss-10]|uniref:AAA protein C-terminal winged helix domain-containing protein n=1 Tax=Cylindrobasidium torrendii FP15055 ss-10 TaxID=1314674 RepID=A0A0D7B449_9AGAR|nr:hypothetical protein CYLTODRAFT_380101 [Cylindrobasidium torrendii FP15055 ss-10]